MRKKTLKYIGLGLLLLLAVGIGVEGYLYIRGADAQPRGQETLQQKKTNMPQNPLPTFDRYIYYALRGQEGFILARAPKGANGQPLSAPQTLIPLGGEFGLAPTDNVLFIQVSPDGHFVAIDGTREHGEVVWMYDVQRATIRLVPMHVEGSFLRWMPSGNGRNGHTFLYRPLLPLGPGAPFDEETWNPGLWIVDAESTTHQNIALGVTSANVIDASPSPDGTRIVYSTSAGLGKGSETWLMQSDGSGRSLLFNSSDETQTISSFFTWSPDGRQIAYERLSDSSTPYLPAGLWVMNAQGSEQRRLADMDGGHGFAPSWSPDGRKIAFVVRTNPQERRANLLPHALQSAIGVVDLTEAKPWLVASSQQTGMPMNIAPDWSMDSASITFTALNPPDQSQTVGAAPRYWTARVVHSQMQPQVSPLTPLLPHVIAIG